VFRARLDTYPLIMEVAGPGDVSAGLREAFVWRGDRGHQYADVTGWWRDAGLLRVLGPGDEGVPLTGDDLARERTRAEVWSDGPADGVLAAHITEAGHHLR
jgi:hypothetical protein